ncbi:DUF2735 domain-containing protein [Methylobacterium sp. A54F]
MSSDFHRETAKIYQFPVRVRAGSGDRREALRPAAHAGSRGSDMAFGGAWYHEAAIQETDRSRKS